MLVAEKLYKSYGDVQVLKGIDIKIEQGKIYALLGVSGTGKSTLLHILGTLDKPDKGKVFFFDTELTALSENQKAKFRNEKLGFVFQFHYLMSELTALENVSLPAWIKGKKNSRETAEKLLVEVGLQDKLHRKPSELSGGEQQRVAVARALINEPEILLADEPTGNLDRKNAENLFALFQELTARKNIGILIATHDKLLAEKSNTVFEIEDGKLGTLTNT